MKPGAASWLFLLFLLSSRLAFAGTVVEKILVEADDQFSLAIVCKGEIDAYDSFRLEDPERLVVDIHGATLGDEIVRHLLLELGGVRSIRSGNHGAFARVVIDFQDAEAPPFGLSQNGSVLLVAIESEEPAAGYPPQAAALEDTAEGGPPAGEFAVFPEVDRDRESAFNSDEAALTGDFAAGEIILLAASEEITLDDEPEAVPAIDSAGSKPPWDIEGRLAVKYSRDLEDDDEFENPNDVRALFEGAVKYTFSPQNFFKAGVRYRYIREWGGEDFDYSKVFPGEIYLNLAGKNTFLGVGTQIIRWGRTDEISPIDVINPEDLTELYMNRRAERKLAVPAVRLGAVQGLASFEFIYLPLFVESEVIYFESDWAVFPHLPARLASASPPLLDPFLRNIRLEENRPEKNLENGEFGARIAGSLSNFDAALTYYYGWEDTPLPAARTPHGQSIRQVIFDPARAGTVFSSLAGPVTEEDFTFDLEYHRFHLFGFDAATNWRNVGFRAEAAYFKDRHFITEDDGTVIREDAVHFVIGADYSPSDRVYLNLLYSYDRVLDAPGLALRSRTQQDIVGYIDGDIGEDFLTLRMYAFWSITDDSVYVNPSLIWTGMDNFTLETGFNLLWADEDGILYPYRNNDVIYLLGSLYF